MKKKHGIHLHVNINNLNKIIKKDERENDGVKRTFHQLETYISALEKFVETYGGMCNVEKFTTSRLHFYFCGDEEHILSIACCETVAYALEAAKHVSTIGKYKNLPVFEIGAGADVGYFVEFEYEDSENDLTEMTTIGSPANRAAKLQSVCVDEGETILVSNQLYNT